MSTKRTISPSVRKAKVLDFLLELTKLGTVTIRPVSESLDIRVDQLDDFGRHVETIGTALVWVAGPYMGEVSSAMGDSTRAAVKKFWPDISWA